MVSSTFCRFFPDRHWQLLARPPCGGIKNYPFPASRPQRRIPISRKANKMSLTRRDFLMRAGQTGGYSAAFVLMQSLGLLAIPEAAAETAPAAPRRRQRHSRGDSRRRHCRPGLGLRTRKSRVVVHDSRSAPAPRRPQLEHPQRHPGRLHRRHAPDLRHSTRATTSTPAPRACPPRTTPCSATAASSASRLKSR